VLIVIIPTIVGLWWRNSSKFLEDGVMQNTAYRFYRQVQENTAAKYVPGILSSANEFCESTPCRNNQADDLSRLHRVVSKEFVKNQGDQNNDIMKVKTLLYAHLLREEVPASLQADYNVVLEQSHKLLNGLLNICMEQRFVTATMNVIEFSQLLMQGLWFHSNVLLQLPHFDMSAVKQCTRLLNSERGASTSGSPIEKLKEIGGAKRREMIKSLNEEQHADVDLFLDNFPNIEITYDARVEDEEEAQEGDVLSLTVKVERKHLDKDPAWEDSDDEDDEPEDKAFDKQLADYDEGTEEYEERKEELMEAWRDVYFERMKKKRQREKARNPQSGELGFAARPLRQPVPVHAPHFPFERAEQWMVLLVDAKSNKLVGYQKLNQNSRFEKVQLKFLAPKEGAVHYEIHCMCSAYMGADKKVLMKKTIAKKKEEEERSKTAAEIAEDEDDDAEDEEEEEPEGKWYYLGGNSFGELILNVIALAIAGVMLFNFMYSRGWWQKFVEPVLNWLLKIAWPFLSFAGTKLHPGWAWFSTNVYDFHHVSFLFENMTASNETISNSTVGWKRGDTSFLNEDPFKPNPFKNPYERDL
jgi:translocation protein SEC63